MQTSIVHDIQSIPPLFSRFALRKLLLAQRIALPSSVQITLESNLIQSTITFIQAHTQPNDVIALYSPILHEPNLLQVAALLNRPLALPVVISKHQALQFAVWDCADTLVPDQYGIGTPAHKQWVSPSVLVIPCLGFNQSNYRLGYGGGFYDRTLHALKLSNPKTLAIGVAYPHSECQFDAHTLDIPMDIILTGRS